MTPSRTNALTLVAGLALGILAPLRASAQCTLPPAGLVGWWPGDGDTRDIAGGAHAGPPPGGVPASSIGGGFVGQGFSFDQGCSYRLAAPWRPQHETHGATICAWVRATLSQSYPGRGIFLKECLSGCATSPLQLYGPDPSGVFTFRVQPSAGGSIDKVSNPGFVANGTWHHVAATHDAAAGGVSRLYVDGIEQGSPVATSPLLALTGDGDCLIGGYPPNRCFEGQIDEVMFFNRALTSAEVQAIHGAGSAGCSKNQVPACLPPPSGLVSWWPADLHVDDVVGPNLARIENKATFTGPWAGMTAWWLPDAADRFRVATDPSLESPSFTLQAWVRPDGLGNAPDLYGGSIMVKEGPPPVNHAWHRTASKVGWR